MGDATYTINQNIAECLRSTNEIGGTVVRNICTGTDTYVPWGSLDWLLCAAGGSIILAFLAMITTMVIAIIRDI